MAKVKQEGIGTFGEGGVEQMISPLSFQRTDDDSVDSLLEPRPSCNLKDAPIKDPLKSIAGGQ